MLMLSLSLCRYYLLCDSNRSCFVLSIYGVRTDVVRTAAEVLFHLLILSFSKVEINFPFLDKCQGWQISYMVPSFSSLIKFHLYA